MDHSRDSHLTPDLEKHHSHDRDWLVVPSESLSKLGQRDTSHTTITFGEGSGHAENASITAEFRSFTRNESRVLFSLQIKVGFWRSRLITLLKASIPTPSLCVFPCLLGSPAGIFHRFSFILTLHCSTVAYSTASPGFPLFSRAERWTFLSFGLSYAWEVIFS